MHVKSVWTFSLPLEPALGPSDGSLRSGACLDEASLCSPCNSQIIGAHFFVVTCCLVCITIRAGGTLGGKEVVVNPGGEAANGARGVGRNRPGTLVDGGYLFTIVPRRSSI